MKTVPAIVLGSGITALGVQRSLHRAGIASFLLETEDPLLRRSRRFRPLPRPVPPAHRQALEEWLPETGFERAVLMPCSDDWARRVAALAPALRARFPSSLTPAAELEVLLDKGKLAEALRRLSVPHPVSYDVHAVAELDPIPDDFFRNAFLKPRESQPFLRRFGVKGFRVTTRAEAREPLGRALEAGLEMILQYYIPGPPSNHFFVDGFIDRHGTERAVFVRQRLRMYPPLFGNSTYMRTVPPAAAAGALESLRRLLGGLGYRGVFSAEFKRDADDGVFKLLEVNARPWWYVQFAAQCGVDVATMAWADALERPVEPVRSYAVGKRCVYPYPDYFACRLLRETGEIGFLGMIWSWIGAHQPIFRWSDPWPGVAGAVQVLRGRFARR